MEVYQCKINQRPWVLGPYSNLLQLQVTAPQVNSAFALLDGQVYCVFQGTAFEAELPIRWLSIRDGIPTSKRNLIIFSTPSLTLVLISQCSIKDNLLPGLDDHRLVHRSNYYSCWVALLGNFVSHLRWWQGWLHLFPTTQLPTNMNYFNMLCYFFWSQLETKAIKGRGNINLEKKKPDLDSIKRRQSSARVLTKSPFGIIGAVNERGSGERGID